MTDTVLRFTFSTLRSSITAQKTNNVNNLPPQQMMAGGGSFQTGFTGLTGLSGVGNLVNPVNPVQTTIEDIARGWRVESVPTNAALSYAMPTNAATVGNWHVHGAASSFGMNVVDFGVMRTSGTLVPTNHWRDVEMVVFAGCAVLDIGDKGNHYSNPASHSASPGLKWAVSSGASALLGYCWKAPLDDQGGVQILNSWCAKRSSLGDVAAWMRANDNMNGRNACAIRLLQSGKIEYRYFRRDGRGWNLRSKYLEIVEEINL